MVFYPKETDFILYMIKYVETHETKFHLILTKNSEVNNRLKNKDEKPKTILSILSFKRKSLSDGILMKHKARICANVGIQ